MYTVIYTVIYSAPHTIHTHLIHLKHSQGGRARRPKPNKSAESDENMDDEDSTYDDSTSNMPSDLYPDMGDEEILASESTTSSMGDGVEVLLVYSMLYYVYT